MPRISSAQEPHKRQFNFFCCSQSLGTCPQTWEKAAPTLPRLQRGKRHRWNSQEGIQRRESETGKREMLERAGERHKGREELRGNSIQKATGTPEMCWAGKRELQTNALQKWRKQWKKMGNSISLISPPVYYREDAHLPLKEWEGGKRKRRSLWDAVEGPHVPQCFISGHG